MRFPHTDLLHRYNDTPQIVIFKDESGPFAIYYGMSTATLVVGSGDREQTLTAPSTAKQTLSSEILTAPGNFVIVDAAADASLSTAAGCSVFSVKVKPVREHQLEDQFDAHKRHFATSLGWVELWIYHAQCLFAVRQPLLQPAYHQQNITTVQASSLSVSSYPP